jgi:hypothetical protein
MPVGVVSRDAEARAVAASWSQRLPSSRPWWVEDEAVREFPRTRKRWNEVMGRPPAPTGLREALGQQYSEFMAEHPTTRRLRIADRDPQVYVDDIESTLRRQPKDTSLGIGSLKGKDQIASAQRALPLRITSVAP